MLPRLAQIGAVATAAAMVVLLVIAITVGRPAGEIAIYAAMAVIFAGTATYVVRSNRA